MSANQNISLRQLLFEERGLHISAIRRMLLLSGIFVLISSVAVGMLHYQLVEQVTAGAGPMLFIPDEMQAMYDSLPNVGDIVGRWLVLMLLLNLVVVGAIAYYAVDKLGRPLVLLRHFLQELGHGRLDIDLELRENDELSEVAESLNEATARIHMMIVAIKENVDTLDGPGGRDPGTVALAVEGCRGALSYFETMQMPDLDDAVMLADAQLREQPSV